MRSVGKWILRIIAAYLMIMGLLFTALIIYYYPVIDRVYIRPCHYYPKAFIDCQVKE